MKKSLRLSVTMLAAMLLLATSAFSNTYTVTTTADSGAGSLRQAITDANANAGADDIVFNIPGGGPWSITVSSALPNLTGPTVIDGTTQPGFVSGTQSTYVKVGTAFTGTIFSASGVTGITIKGLDLSHSSPRNGAGIGLGTCSQTFILDNYIRNRRTGISINGGQDHTVQNNDLLASGENTNEPCVYLLNITPGSIAGGIAMTGNKFGGNANMGFRFDNMNNLIIGDASVSGANIVIEDNSGFTAMGLAGQFMLWFNNCNNVTTDNVDLSWLGGGISNSHGIIFSNAVTNSTFTVKNCAIKNRYSGIQIGNGKDVTIQNNDLRGSGHENSYAVSLNNITEDNVDASWSLGVISNSFGIFVQNETGAYFGQTTSHRNVTIKDCDFRNRGMGIRIRGGKDYTVTGNDLRGCGEHGHHALQLINIQAGTLTGGILAHTNKFGTGASAINNGIYIQQMNDLTIGDATTGGNIKIEDNSGLNQIVGNDVNSRGALYLNTVSNVTVNSVDCSYATGGQAGNSFGIRVLNTASNSNISILNCNAGNRGRGIWVDNGRDYTITGNNMVGSGNGGREQQRLRRATIQF